MSRTLLLAAVVTLAVSRNAAGVSDHLACFKVRDSAPRGRFAVTVATPSNAVVCHAKVPASIGCLPASEQKITPPPGSTGPGGTTAGLFLCYQLKCPRPFPI